MLVAYVSDERYVALPDVLLEFEGESGSFETRSRATGSVHVDLPPGTYKVTPDRFEALSGTVSLPFPPGKHKSVAVKVIDPRGNEVMQVHRLA